MSYKLYGTQVSFCCDGEKKGLGFLLGLSAALAGAVCGWTCLRLSLSHNTVVRHRLLQVFLFLACPGLAVFHQLVSAPIPLAAFSISLESTRAKLLSGMFSITDCRCYLDPFGYVWGRSTAH